MAATFDTLKFVEHLEAGGFTHQQAKAAAEAFADATSQELATKTDLLFLERTMKADNRELEQRMTIRLGGMLVVLAGLLLAAIRYSLPGH